MRPYYDRDGITIYHGKAEAVLPVLDWSAADLVVTDPPYGTGGWRRLESGQGDDPTASLVQEAWDAGDTDFLRLIGTDAACVFWPAARTRDLLNTAIDVGLTKHRTVYMRKPDPKPQVGGRIRWSVEPIWVLSRDGFVLYEGEDGDDLFEAGTPRKGRDRNATGHPYEKPLKVMTWLLAKTDRKRIVDPYMGSGTTLVAARWLGMKAIGIEQEERWCHVAVQRLSQAILPLLEGIA